MCEHHIIKLQRRSNLTLTEKEDTGGNEGL